MSYLLSALLVASTALASILILSNISRDTSAIYDFMLRVTTAATPNDGV